MKRARVVGQRFTYRGTEYIVSGLEGTCPGDRCSHEDCWPPEPDEVNRADGADARDLLLGDNDFYCAALSALQ